MILDPAPDDLVRVAAELGVDPSLVQGAGGNFSLKQGDVLWVKASGCWMADAARRPRFAPLSLSAVLRAMDAGTADRLDSAVLALGQPSNLRPSIETTLHAILPQPAVLHAHAINSLTTAVLRDAEQRFHDAMGLDLAGTILEYVRPGPPLADAIGRALAAFGPPDVILLRNHGVVVAAETPDAAADLLREVERRLHFPVRDLPTTSVDFSSLSGDQELEPLAGYEGVAADPFLFDLLTRLVLMPDQAVFLGGPACGVSADARLDAAIKRFHIDFGQAPGVVLIEGHGGFGRRDRTAGADAMIAALRAIAIRIPRGSVVEGLSQAQVADLLGWDAEHHRRQLDPKGR
jgi:rhamnose utilization protein RhaD (predicted bifunctional aldolase and dehydrogenase)